MITRFLPIFFITLSFLYAQPETGRWNKSEEKWKIGTIPPTHYFLDRSDVSSFLISGARNLYKFFISDLDGDNCPFHPTCSSFFVEAVKEEGPVKGALMFSDRFTRDMNFFRHTFTYPRHAPGKYYDPPCLYTLNRLKTLKCYSRLNIH